jgi:hypothetical protein
MFYQQELIAKEGSLISHSTDFNEVGRVSAKHVRRILTGTNPTEFPVERIHTHAALELGGPAVGLFLLPIVGFYLTQPSTEFDLTINLRGLNPRDDVPTNISMVIDVEGRRELLQFTPNGQAVVRALPYRLKGKVATFQFNSGMYKLDGAALAFPMTEPFIFVLNVNRISDAELRRRSQKADLLNKFDRVVRDIDESIMQREGRLFPAFGNYIANPTAENWMVVRDAANETLEQIRRGVQDARDYDSALDVEELDLAFKSSPREGGDADVIFRSETDSWADFK